MNKYLRLLLSIKEIKVLKDLIKIIIEYFYFRLKYIKKISVSNIKFSKYFQEIILP